MDNPNINIKRDVVLRKIKRQILSHVKIVRVVVLVFFLIVIFVIGFFSFKAISKTVVGTTVSLARDFIFPSTSRIKTSDGRVNVLVLGKGGAGHDAPDLTDTMILVSVSPTSKKMTLISIPRDIWIPDLKDKINSAYMYGKQKQGDAAGLVLAKSTVEEVVGVQIDYAVVIDFNSFKNVIDTLGGVTVDVKNGFTDNQYPIAGKENDTCNGDLTYACRYMTVTFNPGIQKMDGDTALEFVRSRHAVGTEGSDIAREARQQQIIAAIVKAVIMPKTFTNISIDEKLLNIFNQSVQTDLTQSEDATLARYVIDARSNMKSYTIPDNLLYNPLNQYKYFNNIFTHAFVFIPNNKVSLAGYNSKEINPNEDWSDVSNWVKGVIP